MADQADDKKRGKKADVETASGGSAKPAKAGAKNATDAGEPVGDPEDLGMDPDIDGVSDIENGSAMTRRPMRRRNGVTCGAAPPRPRPRSRRQRRRVH